MHRESADLMWNPHRRLLAATFVTKAVAGIMWAACAACGSGSHAAQVRAAPASRWLLNETFDQPDAVSRTWFAVIPEVSGATTLFENGSAQLVLPVEGEIELRHAIDLEAIIQKRGFSIIPSAGVRGLRGGCRHRYHRIIGNQ